MRLQKTIVFVTHDVREALFLATRIALLDQGRLIGVYAPAEFLKAAEPEIRAFAESLRAGWRPQGGGNELVSSSCCGTATRCSNDLLEHIHLVAASMAIALAIGLPVGIALVRRANLQRWVIGAANVVQTIPSLALFRFLIPVPWIGGIGNQHGDCGTLFVRAAAQFCTIGAHRNRWTWSGRRRIRPRNGHDTAPGTLASAVAAGGPGIARGYPRGDPSLCIGVTTIAAAIGAGGLGVFIFRGLAMVNNQVILAGAIPAAILAIAADTGLGYFQRSSAKR